KVAKSFGAILRWRWQWVERNFRCFDSFGFVSDSNAHAIFWPIFPEKRCALESGNYGSLQYKLALQICISY
ncbi:MAG: hypothetical protein O7D30_10710, partial [Rickettsia endosymbiont of Ixodes persulcatus]|nr:hypothetical protein [Rickettsia endosymbiont of Ixodes persulcatus]